YPYINNYSDPPHLHPFPTRRSSDLRAQRRHDVARPGKRADAKLEMVAGRVSRSGELDCDQWHGSAATKWPDEAAGCRCAGFRSEDRKSTRLNSSHRTISYAVFCLKK